jgi:NADPH-dependent glutamate synthase beta subunit-like oxidoreductase/NAD(P)H-flavin reductase
VAFAGGAGAAPYDGERDFALGIPGWRYGDLYEPARLAELDHLFCERVAAADPDLGRRFGAYRDGAAPALAPPAESELLIAVARFLGPFVAELFGVGAAHQALHAAASREQVIFRFKEFVLRRACKRFTPAALAEQKPEAAGVRLFREVAVPALVEAGDDELTTARAAAALLDIEEPLRKLAEGQTQDPLPVPLAATLAEIRGRLAAHPDGGRLFPALVAPGADDLKVVRALLEPFELWAAVHRHDPERHRHVAGWVSFHFPHSVDHADLVPLGRPRPELPNVTEGPSEHRRRRDGFALTDRRMSRREVAAEVDYCLYCHEREKDSCRTGMRDKQGALKKNPLGIAIAGCPLDERISEMHVLQRGGEAIGALAMVVLDNPMCPGTGHRICNDCMKGCVFQKQDPVNIPQIETGVLTDVLRLPFGFEIYSLLCRFNPLDRRRPHLRPYSGKNVLVVGLGPAGYTLAHHLSAEGFGVVAVDGLKIEPLPADLLGADVWPPRAIEDYRELEVDLDRRTLAGFGGVAEYGITVRWDKSFLGVIQLCLARRRAFRAYGGVRFGGTVTVDEAFALGFDHVAIAAGAGKPTIIDLENNLIRGVRKASDFLMALQLTGGFKRDSLANLQVRLPALVVGGGLTGIDTATEMAAYYPVQVEKFLDRWEALSADLGGPGAGEERLWKLYDPEEAEIAREFLEHGRAVRAERERAARAGEAPDLGRLVRQWGGVALCYRRSLQDSPAYRLNHEEVSKFFEEGVQFIEKLAPVGAVADRYGALEAVTFERLQAESDGGGKGLVASGQRVTLPARSLMIAAGTSPNVIYEREHPGTFAIDPKAKAFRSHRAVRGDDGRWQVVPTAAGEVGFFTSYVSDGKLCSYYGDNHPVYAGSVVKAMASAKHGYSHVAALFAEEIAAQSPADQPARDGAWARFAAGLDELWRPTVVRVDRLTPTIVEVVVRARAAARRFRPGQFFRLQNYEALAASAGGSRLVMEGLALTGAWVDKEAGLLSMIVLEMGGSSRLVAELEPGEPVVVMGPTGTPTEIPSGADVVLCGGGLGNAVLFSIAKALREAGSRVLYFAGYRRREDIYKVEEIEAATDQVIWSVDAGELPAVRRPQDRPFRGNIVQAMVAYARGELGEAVVPLRGCTRIIAIGSDRMMAAVKAARHDMLAAHLAPGHVAVASINSPMQCMMKEVCAQCLQRQIDPATGAARAPVFTCFDQDQMQDAVDWKNLADRLRQNTVQEKLADLWVARILETTRSGQLRP